jgi:hypothetical protein
MAKTYSNGRKKHSTLITGRARILSHNNKPSKTLYVLEHLKANRTITSWEAITKYRATRLSSIIWNLRLQGNNITSEQHIGDDGVRFVKYYLNSYLD